MALVAYSDDSDLGTDSEDGDEAQKDVAVKASDGKALGEPPATVPPAAVPPVRTEDGVDSIEDEDDDFSKSENTSSTLFSSVPAAVPVSRLLDVGEVEDDEVVDVPTVETWKVTQELKKQNNGLVEASQSGPQPVPPRKERKKVKIFVPSLSEFSDDDEEEESKEPPKKKLNPSKGGSGLFSVLPEPKHLTAKETGRSLVPHVLTKRPTQPKKPQAKIPKAAVATPGVGTSPVAKVAGHASDEEEDETPAGTIDFFSLSEPTSIDPGMAGKGLVTHQASAAAAAGGAAAAPYVLPLREVAEAPSNQPDQPSSVMQQQYQDYEMEGPSDMVPSPSQPAVTAAATTAGGIDEATILRLAGKRGRAEAINFIDVNADDALLTRHEWMTKALTEEKPMHGFSKKREGLPTQKQKQKHQITYLAHQAKERELDLKNTWAQNKMTKMQSQAKYGF